MTRVAKTPAWRATWVLDRIVRKLTNGRVTLAPGLPTAVLETRGARTGRLRQTPVIYFHDGSVVTVIASQAGYPGNPAWYYNARAKPAVRLGGDEFEARIVDAPDELIRLWRLADKVFPGFSRYRADAAEAGRTIPIVQLHPATALPVASSPPRQASPR